MATRLYFSSTRPADITVPYDMDDSGVGGNGEVWEINSNASRWYLSPGKGSSPIVEGTVQSWPGFNNTSLFERVLDRQYISGPLAAQTFRYLQDRIEYYLYMAGDEDAFIPKGTIFSVPNAPDLQFYIERDTYLELADDWAPTTHYNLTNVVTNNGNIYVCNNAGTTGADGPSGTGSSIQDGTAYWTYVGPGLSWGKEYVINTVPGETPHAAPYTITDIEEPIVGLNAFTNPNFSSETFDSAFAYNYIIGMLPVRQYSDQNVTTLWTRMFIVSADGQTIRGSLLELDFQDSGDPFNFTQYQNRAFYYDSQPTYSYGTTFHASDIEIQEGDRLVFEIGWTDWDEGTDPSASAKYGEAGDDLPFHEDPYPYDPLAGDFTVGAPWIELTNNLIFLDHPTFSATITGETNITAGLRVLADRVYYHVYYAIKPQGPWTRATVEPLVDVAEGNQYDLGNLTNGQVYYIMVVGGRLDEDRNFIPVCGQPIVNSQDPGTDVSNPNMIAARPKRISSSGTVVLGMQVYLEETGTL